MTLNQRFKKYLEAHPGATVENWQNQCHRMHIIQYNSINMRKHSGSKPKKKMLDAINQYNAYLQKRKPMAELLSKE